MANEGHDKEEIKNLDTSPKVEEAEDLSPENAKDVHVSEENEMPPKQQEEEVIKKMYGGLLLKKPPLISKDNERAFFDSADWALGKKSKGPPEALRPKLQPTPHPQLRSRSAYAPSDGGEDEAGNLRPGENLDAGDPNIGGTQGNTEECSNCHCSENQNLHK